MRSLVLVFIAALLTSEFAGSVSAETLVSATFQIHEAELVAASEPALQNPAATVLIQRSTIGGLGAGPSTGLSGLQLDGSFVGAPVPEPSVGLRMLVPMLVLLQSTRARRLRSRA